MTEVINQDFDDDEGLSEMQIQFIFIIGQFVLLLAFIFLLPMQQLLLINNLWTIEQINVLQAQQILSIIFTMSSIEVKILYAVSCNILQLIMTQQELIPAKYGLFQFPTLQIAVVYMCYQNNKANKNLISDTEFRCQSSQETVHELRNQVYSANSLQKEIKNFDLDEINTQKLSFSINELFEHNEQINQLINLQYKTDLIISDLQYGKLNKMSPTELMNKLKKYLNILFQNKNMKINIESDIQYNDSIIIMDYDLFKMLIHNILRLLHKNKICESSIKICKENDENSNKIIKIQLSISMFEVNVLSLDKLHELITKNIQNNDPNFKIEEMSDKLVLQYMTEDINLLDQQNCSNFSNVPSTKQRRSSVINGISKIENINKKTSEKNKYDDNDVILLDTNQKDPITNLSNLNTNNLIRHSEIIQDDNQIDTNQETKVDKNDQILKNSNNENNIYEIGQNNNEIQINLNHNNSRDDDNMLQNDNLFSDGQDEPVEQVIYVNVDDEKGVLNMNKRLFKKLQIDLEVQKNSADFYIFLNEKQSTNCILKIILIMDQQLENEYGTDVLNQINENYKTKNENIQQQFQGLTSTEDKVVKKQFMNMGSKYVQNKPLKKYQIFEIISNQ